MKINTPGAIVIGVVSGLSSPMAGSSELNEVHLAELTLAGEIQAHDGNKRPTFRRGVSSSPAIGDTVETATRFELECVYIQPNTQTIEVGTLFQDSAVTANLLIDDLFGKHFLVVGSTGSGKSCAIRAIMSQVLKSYDQAHIVILDVHNEYADAFGEKAESIRPRDLQLPFWLLNFEELCSVLTSNDGNRDAEVDILADAVLTAKRRYFKEPMTNRIRRGAESAAKITVDTPSPFLLSAVVSHLDEQMGRLDRA